MQYLLDTNICVFFLRGKLALDSIIRQKGRENCFISEITVIELYYGAEKSDNPVKSHKAVDSFKSVLQSYHFMVLPNDTQKRKLGLID